MKSFSASASHSSLDSMWDIVLLPVPLVLLTMLATFLMPPLSFLLHSLPVPPRVLSLTFLSFANAAPDLLTCFSALRQGTPAAASMGLAEIVGSATFSGCVVFGTVAIMAGMHGGLKVVSNKWAYDILALLSVTLYVVFVIHNGRVTLFDSILLTLAYFLIISTWIWRSKASGLFVDFCQAQNDDLVAAEGTITSYELPIELQQDLATLHDASIVGRASAEHLGSLHRSNTTSPHDAGQFSPFEISEPHSVETSLQQLQQQQTQQNQQLGQQNSRQECLSPPPLSPSQSNAYLLHDSVYKVRSGSMDSIATNNSGVSPSSDLGEFYFHTNIDNLERGNSWRLPLIDSVRLAMVGMKSKGSGNVSRISRTNSLARMSSSSEIQRLDSSHHSYPVFSSKLDPVDETLPPNEQEHKEEELAVHLKSPLPKKKNAPGIVITEAVPGKVSEENIQSAVSSASRSPLSFQPNPHLNTDLEQGLTYGASPVVSRKRSTSLSFDISAQNRLNEGVDDIESQAPIHYLTPNIYYRFCPIHMATKKQGIERLYHFSIIPLITVFNLIIPIPIPAELRERDFDSFKWEFALTRKLFHFQLFWFPWIFTDFGTSFYPDWKKLTLYVILPSIMLPICAFLLDCYILRNEPPIEMPNNSIIDEQTGESQQQTQEQIQAQPKPQPHKAHKHEIFPIVLSIVSFVYVIKLLSLTTSFLVTLIMKIAADYQLSESLLAITVVSLANSASDVITAAALTKLGRIDVAVSSVAGGLICYLAGGVGGVSLVTLLSNTRVGPGLPDEGAKLTQIDLEIDGQLYVQLGALGIMLLICLAVVPFRNWQVEKWIGFIGVSLWLCGILFGWIVGFDTSAAI